MPQFLGLIISPGAEYSALLSYYQSLYLTIDTVCRKLLCLLIILMEITNEPLFMVEQKYNDNRYDP